MTAIVRNTSVSIAKMNAWSTAEWTFTVPAQGSLGNYSVKALLETDKIAQVKVRKPGIKDWMELDLTHGLADTARGPGVADMAYALRTGRPHRASGELAYHVLDIMHAFHDAARESRTVELASTCKRPAPLPPRLKDGVLDE